VRRGRRASGAALVVLVALGSGGCAWLRRARAPEAGPTAPAETPPPARPAPAPAPPAPAPPAPPPAVAPPPAPPRPAYRPPATVRVGLHSDLESVTLPCCDGEVTAVAGNVRLEVVSPVTIRSLAQPGSAPVWRLQAAALRDQGPAAQLARRLAAKTGERSDFAFDAGSGLFRVRLGAWRSRAEAEEAAKRLRPLGLYQAWVVSEGSGPVGAALELEQRGRQLRLEGRRFRMSAPPGGGLRVEGRRYRGTIEVFLNDRGRLNVINEVAVEDYLRGVVPRELGPVAYPELEAQKAQAVAARSYLLRNLGGFAEEGYDICGTPQCQVYGGMEDEHPLSDRAVAETAGEVLVADELPADSLYSATCGGHTENVEVVFPLKSAPYLRGAPCIESGGVRLAGGAGSRASWPLALLARFLPRGGEVSSELEFEAGLRTLVGSAGLAPADDRLGSLARREVLRYLASQLDLATDARLFVRGEELDYLVADPPADWSEDDRRFAAWLVKSGLLAGPADAPPLTRAEARELLLRVALQLGLVDERIATFSTARDGQIVVREGAADESYPLEPSLATFREEGGKVRGGELLIVPGDDLRLYFDGARLAAVVQEVSAQGAAYDRDHPRGGWRRFKTDVEVAALVRGRFPGFEIADFELLDRGVSGRVGRLRMKSVAGETIDVEGLAVRWTLDLPDTLFSARRLKLDNGRTGWQFTGRGWGHGVGMCQLGAVGMARRGHDYRSILEHYYRGAALRKYPVG
jgi:stage II sporulation protein D